MRAGAERRSDRHPEDLRVGGLAGEVLAQNAVEVRVVVTCLVRVHAVEHPEQREEDRDLYDDGQAAGERVGAGFLPERHHFLVEALFVVLVLGLQLFHLWLQRAHGALRLDLLDEQREQQQPHRHREQDDGQRPGRPGAGTEDRREAVVDVDDQPGDRVVERVQQGHEIAHFSVEAAGTGS